MMPIRKSLTLSLMGPALVWAQDMPFEAPSLQPSQSDFGGVGLMQMPTGRMAPEGEFNFSVTGSDEYLFLQCDSATHAVVRNNHPVHTSSRSALFVILPRC